MRRHPLAKEPTCIASIRVLLFTLVKLNKHQDTGRRTPGTVPGGNYPVIHEGEGDAMTTRLPEVRTRPAQRHASRRSRAAPRCRREPAHSPHAHAAGRSP